MAHDEKKFSRLMARLGVLDGIATSIGLIRLEAEDDEALGSRCHDRIDEFIRAHAAIRSDAKLMKLMELHDAVAAYFHDE